MAFEPEALMSKHCTLSMQQLTLLLRVRELCRELLSLCVRFLQLAKEFELVLLPLLQDALCHSLHLPACLRQFVRGSFELLL
jgi:hypothetical protein